MGFGDDVIASAYAKGLKAQGKRAAFGDRKRIIWGPWSEEIFRYNPNVARPGSEGSKDLIWIDHYKGHRKYNRMSPVRDKWIWNYNFRVQPGEIIFSTAEVELAEAAGKGFILIEPNVPWHKSVAPNKDWGLKKYQAVADRLVREGYDVVQTAHGRDRLKGIRSVVTPTFRDALALLSRASVALVPEGGLHHGAAAVGTKAVVLFGGFIPTTTMGYDTHVNLGNGEACGSLMPCLHCRDAMNRISVEEVYEAVKGLL